MVKWDPAWLAGFVRENADVHLTRAYLRVSGGKAGVLDRPALEEGLSEGSKVLFLCHGNICRSPMAARYVEEQVGDEVEAESAGFYDEEGRSSPKLAVEAAERFGVDLSGHRSQVVDEELVDESDVVVLMDVRNYVRFRGHYPEKVEKAFLLRAGREDFEISDPYGKDIGALMEAFAEVTRSIDSLLGPVSPE